MDNNNQNVNSNLQSIADNINRDKILNNTIVIANTVEVISSVIKKCAGVDIADVINNQSLTKNIIDLSIVNNLKKKILA